MERTYDEPEEAEYSDSNSESDWDCSMTDQGRGVVNKVFPRQGSFWTQDEGAKNNVHLIQLPYTCFNTCGDAYWVR
jgi:hypothetical protein